MSRDTTYETLVDDNPYQTNYAELPTVESHQTDLPADLAAVGETYTAVSEEEMGGAGYGEGYTAVTEEQMGESYTAIAEEVPMYSTSAAGSRSSASPTTTRTSKPMRRISAVRPRPGSVTPARARRWAACAPATSTRRNNRR
jgi:hypothetical protein